MRFVIVGGDAAGMSAASRAKRHQPYMDVVVFEQTGDVSYSACGMPYNIADEDRDMDDLVVRAADVFRDKQGIDLRLGHTVESIDRDMKKVTGRKADGEPFEITYDALLIATGARPRKLGIPGEDLPGVLPLKSLQDGRDVKTYMAGMSTNKVLIVGAGYIGLEMAEAYRERGVEVEMTKPTLHLLPWLPDRISEFCDEELERNNVVKRFGVIVKCFERCDDGIRVIFDDGSHSDVGMVLVGIGITPNSEMARDAGLALGPGNSIAVDKGLRTSDPTIYAAGDCADAFHIITGKRVWIPLALRANRAGWAVADNVMGQGVELPGIVGTAVFKMFDLEIARTGFSLGEAQREGFDAVENTIKSRTRAHAHPGSKRIFASLVADKQSGKLLGGTIVGQEGAAHRINSVAVALHAGMTVEELVQCDMAYAPPFGPVWDPVLTAGNQLMKELT